MELANLVNTGSGNDLVPDGTKPLSEPALTWSSKGYHSIHLTENFSIGDIVKISFTEMGLTITCSNLLLYLPVANELINKSLGPSDAIWRHRSGPTSTQVMACCLTAPTHNLNQCQGVQRSGKSQGNSRLGKSQGKVREFCWRSGKKWILGKVREKSGNLNLVQSK